MTGNGNMFPNGCFIALIVLVIVGSISIAIWVAKYIL